MTREAELVRTERGLVPKGDGWSVLNAREAYARFPRSRLTPYRDGRLPE